MSVWNGFTTTFSSMDLQTLIINQLSLTFFLFLSMFRLRYTFFPFSMIFNFIAFFSLFIHFIYYFCAPSLYFWSSLILLRICFKQMFPLCSFEWDYCDCCRLSTWCVFIFYYLFNIWVNGSGKLDLECYL